MKTNGITNIIAIVAIVVLCGIALILEASIEQVIALAAALGGVFALGAVGKKAVSVLVLGALLLVVGGCGITDPINTTSLDASKATTTSDAGALARVPTYIVDENGNSVAESMTVKTPGGLNAVNADASGIYDTSSQPKAVMTLPFTNPPAFVASPSDITVGQMDIPIFDEDGEVKTTMKITNLSASVSAPITALNEQVIAVLEATKSLSTDERIRKIEQMKTAGQITEAVAQAAIKAIITGITGVPTP